MLKLILLPGMDGTGKLFEPLVDHLGTAYPIEIVRYPGDRCVTYPQLADLVQSVIPRSEPFVLIAESFSSPLAVICAALSPSNLKGLILCAGFVSRPLRGWRRRLSLFLAPLCLGNKMRRILPLQPLAGPNPSPQLASAIRSAIASADSSVLAHRLRSILNCDVLQDLKTIHVPILYLQAQNDLLIGPSCLDEIVRVRPNTRIEPIDSPHLLFQSEPARCASVITAWLGKITHCNICTRPLDVSSDPLSADCGGDCWGCISQIEAELIGVPVDQYRAAPSNFLPDA